MFWWCLHAIQQPYYAIMFHACHTGYEHESGFLTHVD